MKIRFLGTAAAGGYPNPHCRCEHCVAARAEGGKSLRAQSSAMVDDDLLIGLGPDVPLSVLRQGIDLADVRWVLQTHPHDDHLLPLQAVARSAPWAAQGAQPMQWFGTAGTLARIQGARSSTTLDMAVGDDPGERKLTLTEIGPWQEIRFGRYRVQTVAANHTSAEEPMLFAIEANGRRMFYGSDTSTVPEDTWTRLAELGWAFDLVVFDHNDGHQRPVSKTHMGAAGMLREISIMRGLGVVHDRTRIFGTHLSHHSCEIHSVESARAEAMGYEIA